MEDSVKNIIEGRIRDKLIAKKDGLGDDIVVLDIDGEDGGAWTIDCKNGEVVRKDYDDATLRVKISAEDFLDMAQGKSNPMSLMFKGKIKIKGNIKTASKLALLLK